jgi:crotonobetainyl-CoA:carnitine CoA-transferase CaiB-like acyl-CoA transferase
VSRAAPLAGVVVVELGASVAAPFAGQILGDLGAEVVKVEKADGDDARKWGPPFLDGAAATFQALNRNKRSVVCDLRDPRDRDRLLEFIRSRADVVLQNMRPGQVDALGLGAAALCAAKPALVYCNIGAFGGAGPLADRPGYDPLMQGFGGIMSVVGEEGRPPVRVGPSIIDCGTALWAVVGILAALYRRRETGKGGVVDVSLFETAASWMNLHAVEYLASGELPGRGGSGRSNIVPYRAYRTADGDLVVAAGNDALYRKLCGALGHPEWADDPRFLSNPERVVNAAALYALIEVEMATRTNAEWIAALDAAGVPCAPVQNVREMLEHPQTRSLGILQTVPGLSVPLVGLPVSFDGVRPTPRSGPPALGEATAELLGNPVKVGA